MRPMTKAAALKEAVRRWGKNAAVRWDPPLSQAEIDRRLAGERSLMEKREEHLKAAKHVPAMPYEERLARRLAREGAELERCRNGFATVGVVMLGMFFEVRGEGPTFEDAFIDYDWTQAKEENELRDIAAFLSTLKATPKLRCGCRHPCNSHAKEWTRLGDRYLATGQCGVPACECRIFKRAVVDPAIAAQRAAALEKARAAGAAKRAAAKAVAP